MNNSFVLELFKGAPVVVFLYLALNWMSKQLKAKENELKDEREYNKKSDKENIKIFLQLQDYLKNNSIELKRLTDEIQKKNRKSTK